MPDPTKPQQPEYEPDPQPDLPQRGPDTPDMNPGEEPPGNPELPNIIPPVMDPEM